ncbi:MAG: NUDIX domain-containing protein [Bacteroidales bacterium]|nr:NUDIX domain-containing protein [Bacteroidales bacterium]MBO5980094.1 NUDIX domain-containing protein [Bacteroidales bacterium]
MLELVYPYDIAPVIPAPTADSTAFRGQGSEWLPVVLPSGLVIGRSTREYCHSEAKPLHPVVHIHIIDRYSRIYLQKRPMHKTIQPGKWDTAVGGHVSYGESILEAAYREAFEELNFVEFNPIHLETYEFESPVEKEMVNVFAAVGSYDLTPDPDEVEEGRWWELSEIDENIGKGVFTPNFESEFQMIRSSLLALL